jgi:predicted Zn-dependent protease with MMP-like domain
LPLRGGLPLCRRDARFGPRLRRGDRGDRAAALKRLPEPFAGHLGDVVLQVEEFADDETLRDGHRGSVRPDRLYEGVPLTEKSVEQSGTLPDRIRLFRRPILDEWADGETRSSISSPTS